MGPMERLERGLNAFAKALGRRPLVARLYADLDAQLAGRQIERADPRSPRLAIAFTVLAVFGIVALFHHQISRILEFPPPVYGDSRLFNLTRSGVMWDAYYGTGESCGTVDCYVTAAQPAEKYQKSVVLPLLEFPLQGYTKGQTIFYRAKLKLPAHIIAQAEILLFHSVYIWGESYEFYVNDQLVDVGKKSLLNIPIPRGLIPADGHLTVAFRIDPGALPYQGLTHYGDLIIGPKDLLAGVSFTAREIKTTYYLWYVLPRISICVLFCFLFLSMRKNRENFFFFVFVLTSSARVFIVTDYAEDMLPQGLSGVLVSRILGCYESLVFLMFVESYFRRHRPQFRLVLGAAFALVTAYVAAPLLVPVADAPTWILRLEHALRIATVAYAVALSVTTTLYLAQNRKSPVRLHTSLFLSGFLSLSLLFHVASAAKLVPGQYVGVFANTHELLLCFVLAGLVAFEFGSTVTQRDTIKRRLRTVVDPKVADQLLERPESLKGQACEVTILFSDIRSFTTISEVYPAEEVVEMLNAYLEAMVGVIAAHGGVVDKFIGDAIMAVWGAPVQGPNDALAAARCAVAMRRALGEFNEARRAAGKFEIAIGIGLHSGRVIAGGVGSEQRLDYTVIGDTVNAAARIEAMTKELRTDLVISATTLAAIESHAVAAPCGEFKLRGKQRALAVYRLLGVFDETGVLACHDAVYERLALPASPGLVTPPPPNLREHHYGLQLAS